ncbi:MAG: threonylcarbamoyl-AMP synthase [Cyclobacteriaceae bacterium]|nr:threonylcarbamoyl-AMP synthase [Cyclobacteriaceae bacterium]
MAEIGKDITKAKQLLEAGELVAIPTETVYGLAGNALDVTAVTKIFVAKNRPEFDPLIVHIADRAQVNVYAENIPELAQQLAERFWPGPLTLVLRRKNNIPDLVTSGLDTVGIRCPDHALTRELLQSLSFPLAAPSANPFGYVSPTTPAHVNDQLGDKLSYILDGGACEVGIESTIIGFENDAPVVFRMGGLSLEKIEAVVGKVHIATHSSSNPKAPGQLVSHYAPRKKVILGDVKNLLKDYAKEVSAVLSFKTNFNVPHQFILSPSGNVEEAAQRFFTALRDLDKLPVDVILAEQVPNVGLGRAINDRLHRASAA